MKKVILTLVFASAVLFSQSAFAQMVGGAMMVPSKTIPENASNAKNLTTLVAAVKTAGLVPTLSGDGPFTVFAPTNEAFDKLPKGTVANLLKPENDARLKSILTYHVVAGRYMAKDLKNGMMLKTVNGESLKITRKGSHIMVNGARVLVSDVVDKNGVSFIINKVLLPK